MWNQLLNPSTRPKILKSTNFSHACWTINKTASLFQEKLYFKMTFIKLSLKFKTPKKNKHPPLFPKYASFSFNTRQYLNYKRDKSAADFSSQRTNGWRSQKVKQLAMNVLEVTGCRDTTLFLFRKGSIEREFFCKPSEIHMVVNELPNDNTDTQNINHQNKCASIIRYMRPFTSAPCKHRNKTKLQYKWKIGTKVHAFTSALKERKKHILFEASDSCSNK